MNRLLKGALTVGAAAVALVVVVDRSASVRRAVRRVNDDAGRGFRHLRGVSAGAWYRISGNRPDPDVSDDVLAQRVRSTLGPLQKERDLPRVHVTVDDGFVTLHGEAPTHDDVFAIERSVLRVSGVVSIESYLHVGLTSGTTRPSEGRAAQAARPSDALVALRDAAVAGGASEAGATLAVRAALAAFAERLPEDDCRQLFSHLPTDVRDLSGAPVRHGRTPRLRTIPQLVASVTMHGGVDPAAATSITGSVLGYLRTLVPEEADDVAAVLPHDLRDLWNAHTTA